MKKSNVAAAVVVALGIAWTSGAFLTGKQIEERISKMVNDANVQLEKMALENRLKISYLDYQRGIFTSNLKLVIQASSQTHENLLLKPGQQIVLNETIDHGPFPLSQLKKFHLLPELASVHSVLEETPPVEALFKASQAGSVIQAETQLSYSGATRSAVRLLPLHYQNGSSGETVVWNGGVLNVDADAEGNKVDVDSKVDSLSLTSKNHLDQPVLFNVNGITFTAKTRLSAQNLRTGEHQLSLDKVTASVNGQETVMLKGLKGNFHLDADEKTLSGQTEVGLDDLSMHEHSFGQGKLLMKWAHVDTAALKTFFDYYNKQMNALRNQPDISSNLPLFQQQANQILLNGLPALLKGGPAITIAPLSWKNSQGESRFDFSARFKDPSHSTEQQQPLDQVVAGMLQSLDGKLVISMKMATELMTRIAMAEGQPQEQASKQAEQQVRTLAGIGVMAKLTTLQDNNITARLEYSGGEIIMNGEKMTASQFLSHFWQTGATPPPVTTPAH